MLIPVLLFIVGLLCLIKGGDWFVDGATGIARRFHVPELLIGATVVSIGTTLPEVMVSTTSALTGHGEIAYGNAIGSVICNSALIAAIPIVVKPGKVDPKSLRTPVLFFFVAAAFYAGVAYTTGSFTRPVGIILLAMFVAYMVANVLQMKKAPAAAEAEAEAENAGEEMSLTKTLVLLVLGMVVSGVVGAFEKVVSRLTIIMAFQSLILDMAGNVGTQSLAVTIRVLMDKEITARKKLGLVCKEMRVGLFSGLILGSLSVLFVGAYIMLGKGYPAQYAFAVSVCIGAALLLAMFISSAVGTLIPMFFKRIGVDPAVASGPLITTVNDLVAVVTYYGLSWLLLLQVLHLGS